MKRKYILTLCVLTACLCAAFALVGCGENPNEGEHYVEISTPTTAELWQLQIEDVGGDGILMFNQEATQWEIWIEDRAEIVKQTLNLSARAILGTEMEFGFVIHTNRVASSVATVTFNTNDTFPTGFKINNLNVNGTEWTDTANILFGEQETSFFYKWAWVYDDSITDISEGTISVVITVAISPNNP